MQQDQDKKQNTLALYRRRMRFSQKVVARLVGLKGTDMLSRYENGRSTPPLVMALRLEIAYRVPVAFLFPTLYVQLRNEIRGTEEALRIPIQQTLF